MVKSCLMGVNALWVGKESKVATQRSLSDGTCNLNVNLYCEAEHLVPVVQPREESPDLGRGNTCPSH